MRRRIRRAAAIVGRRDDVVFSTVIPNDLRYFLAALESDVHVRLHKTHEVAK